MLTRKVFQNIEKTAVKNSLSNTYQSNINEYRKALWFSPDIRQEGKKEIVETIKYEVGITTERLGVVGEKI